VTLGQFHHRIHRRARLEAILAKVTGPRLFLSEGNLGNGLALFEHTKRFGLEGVVAKRLDSRYEPGQRSGSWSKFKHRRSIVAVVIGYLPSSTGGLKSLLLAAEVDGATRFIGLVGSGMTDPTHRKLLGFFPELAQQKPAIAVKLKGARWLKPKIFCRVSFMEWTNQKKLRAPVFEAVL
jgi:bifunctional non-homologous end joining protein LigD